MLGTILLILLDRAP